MKKTLITAKGDRTKMIFHLRSKSVDWLRGFTGHPGDQYVYEGLIETLDTIVKNYI